MSNQGYIGVFEMHAETIKYSALRKDLGLLGSRILTPEILRVFAALGMSKALTVNELRERAEVGANFVARLIAILKDKGVVEVRRDPEDGRRKIIALTPKGRKLLDSLTNLKLILDELDG